MRLSSFLSLLLIWLLVIKPLPAQSPSNVAPLVITVMNADGSASVPGTREQKGFTVQISDAIGMPVADAAVVLRFPDSGPSATFSDGTHAGVAYTDAMGRAEISGMQWSTEAGTVPIKVTATKGTAHAGTIIEQQLGTEKQAVMTPLPDPSKEVPQVAVLSQPKPVEQATPAAERPKAERTVQPGVVDRVSAPALVASAAPSISVTNRPSSEKLDSGGGHKKWIILLIAVAAGVGVGVAMAGKKSSSSSSTGSASSTGTTIGSPTVSVGAP